ncbi:UNVERIFIED_CONTAM: hypothetical protein PYX00_003630 [Menopon gallinae]|uniref:CHK kinase-like domain-containing protein n=1 Tax=Menopon gallinae TaxID=328185 RepID=A0AAW2I1V9_9NEOP
MKLSQGCPTGENFVGEVLRVFVEGHAEEPGEEESEFTESFIVKRIPDPGSFGHTIFNLRRIFENEIAGYEAVVGNFEDFANRKKSPRNWKGTCFAKYYGSAYDIIALEDLKPKGYQMGNRVQGFNVQECLLVLEKLSYFHAVSVSMKSVDGGRFGDVAARLREPFFTEETELGKFWENAVKLAVRSLEDRKDHRLEAPLAVMKSYLGSVFSGMSEVIAPREPFDVICHGDLWINNILIRYVDGVAVDARMVDLQSMKHGSCVLDLMYFLFTSLEVGLLRPNIKELINFYYIYLAFHVRSLGSTMPFSFPDLMAEMRRRIRYGICVASLMYTVVTKNGSETSEEATEIPSEDVFEMEYRSLNDLYHRRIYNLIMALTDLQLI